MCFKYREAWFVCADKAERKMPMVTARWLIKQGKWKNLSWNKQHKTHTVMCDLTTKEYFAVENL